MKTYDTKIDQAQKGAPYVATSDKGKAGHFEKYNLTKRLAIMESEIKFFRGYYESENLIGKDMMESLEMTPKKHIKNQVYAMMQNTKMLFPNEEYYGLEFIGGYISNVCKIKEIAKGELPIDVLKGYTKFEDGKFVIDEEKKQEYLNTLG